jgi:hypothetical protein
VPLAGAMKLKRMAAVFPPLSLPQNIQLFRPTAIRRSALSLTLLCVPCEGTLNPWVQFPPGDARPSRKYLGRSRRRRMD